MSRSDEFGRSEEGKYREDRKPFGDEAGARLGISREAAKVEMERFRGVEHYTVRKIIGQKSARTVLANADGQYPFDFLTRSGDQQ